MPDERFPEDAAAPKKLPVIMDAAFRKLFVKYIRYLYDVEGSAFISDLYRQQATPDVIFTDAEWYALVHLDKEAAP